MTDERQASTFKSNVNVTYRRMYALQQANHMSIAKTFATNTFFLKKFLYEHEADFFQKFKKILEQYQSQHEKIFKNTDQIKQIQIFVVHYRISQWYSNCGTRTTNATRRLFHVLC